MSEVIHYHLKNNDGEQVGIVKNKQKTFETVIIVFKGCYYRPIHYDCNTHIAICIPVDVINGGNDNEDTLWTENQQKQSATS